MPGSRNAVALETGSSVKNVATEELFDLLVSRRIAAVLADALARTPISANQVTLAGAALGALAGLLIASGARGAFGWAAFCLFASMVLDCADGQLARLRGGGTRLGRALDGISDYTTATALHLGMWSHLSATGVLFRERLVDGWGLVAWMLIAGASMSVQCLLFDFRKQWFLAHTTPDRSEMVAPGELRALMKEATHPAERVGLWIYVQYARGLRLVGGSPEASFIDDDGHRAAFARRSETFLRAASFLGPTTHLLLIGLAMIAAPLFAESFWWYVLTVAVPMNLAYAALVLWGRRLDASLRADGIIAP